MNNLSRELNRPIPFLVVPTGSLLVGLVTHAHIPAKQATTLCNVRKDKTTDYSRKRGVAARRRLSLLLPSIGEPSLWREVSLPSAGWSLLLQHPLYPSSYKTMSLGRKRPQQFSNDLTHLLVQPTTSSADEFATSRYQLSTLTRACLLHRFKKP